MLASQIAASQAAPTNDQVPDAPKQPGCLVHDVVFHEAAYPVRVIRPIRGRSDGIGPLVVQVYALGSGVTVSGERGDLSGRQGAFELEANGKFFVFDPLGAGKTNGFVSVIERDIAAIWHQFKTVDEVQPPQGRDAFLHLCSSLKTTILSLPQGFGKTSLGALLAAALGLNTVVDDWQPGLTLLPGALHLTSFPFSTGEVVS